MSDYEVSWNDEAEEELTEKQKRILETVGLNPEMSNAEIAAETDSSTSYVRDIRDRYEDKMEVGTEENGGASGLVILLILLLAVGYAYQAGLL